MKFLVPITIVSVVHVAGCSTAINKPGLLEGSADTASMSSVENSRSPTTPQSLIARDFVNAIAQLDSFAANSTIVELSDSQRDDQFTQAMQLELEGAGYATRWVQDESSSELFQYRQVSEKAAALTQRSTYELAIGSAELRRSYATDDTGRVQPVTPLFVRGTDATGLVLNDDIFASSDSDLQAYHPDFAIGSASATEVINVNAVPLKRVAEAQQMDIAQVNETQPEETQVANTQVEEKQGIETQAETVDRPSSRRLPPDANPLNSAVGEAVANSAKSWNLQPTAEVANVFDLGSSNFENLLVEHDIIKEQVLTFANDSMRLGALNKQLVDQLVGQYNPGSDIFTVIGCSMGPTGVNGGNAALALGRAGRVVEALRFAGVNDEHIFDEGCWAGDGGFEDLPRRGVVLTLNRRA